MKFWEQTNQEVSEKFLGTWDFKQMVMWSLRLYPRDKYLTRDLTPQTGKSSLSASGVNSSWTPQGLLALVINTNKSGGPIEAGRIVGSE